MTAVQWGRWALVTVSVVGVGAALLLSVLPEEYLRYQEEWVKALLQAGLISVLGAVTSQVLESFKDGLQHRRDQSKIRFDVLADIGRIYMDVKLVRRRAQEAEAIGPVDLRKLNARQVRLELHKDLSSALFDDKAGLESALDTMEKYLNKVANKPDSDERLQFVDRDGFKEFSLAYREARAIMQHDLAGPRRTSVTRSRLTGAADAARGRALRD